MPSIVIRQLMYYWELLSPCCLPPATSRNTDPTHNTREALPRGISLRAQYFLLVWGTYSQLPFPFRCKLGRWSCRHRWVRPKGRYGDGLLPPQVQTFPALLVSYQGQETLGMKQRIHQNLVSSHYILDAGRKRWTKVISSDVSPFTHSHQWCRDDWVFIIPNHSLYI